MDASNAFARAEPSVFGAVALVAGTTVGAGMLALPSVCQESGAVPSTAALLACWAYMVATGLLVLEVSLETMRRAGTPRAGLISSVDRTLGRAGVAFAYAAYVFIHYALLVAYIARCGEILADDVFANAPVMLNSASCGALYAASLGGFIFAADDARLERFNNALVALVLASFAPLLVLAFGNVDPANYAQGDWSAVPNTVPVIALAFVFHNVVPVTAQALEGDAAKCRTALVAGTAIPLAMFAAWNAALLGSVGERQAIEAMDAVARSGGAIQAIADPLASLRASSPLAATLATAFSFFAISTSFLGFVLGLTDFLADGGAPGGAIRSAAEAVMGGGGGDEEGGAEGVEGLRERDRRREEMNDARGDEEKRSAGGGKKDASVYAAALIPPTLFATSNPDVFLDALDVAGTFGVLTLFGCMPPLMAWSQRGYGGARGGGEGPATAAAGAAAGAAARDEGPPELVPGGRLGLAALFAAAAYIVAGESFEKLGYLIFDR